MGCIDSFVEFGKKFLPPPAVLFITHLIFATMCVGLGLVEKLFWSDSSAGQCKVNFIIWIEIGVAVTLSVLVALAKYKEKGDILATIVALFAFFATIFGIQYYPFYCLMYNSTLVYFIIRVLICIPLVIIYAVLCKADLDQILPN